MASRLLALGAVTLLLVAGCGLVGQSRPAGSAPPVAAPTAAAPRPTAAKPAAEPGQSAAAQSAPSQSAPSQSAPAARAPGDSAGERAAPGVAAAPAVGAPAGPRVALPPPAPTPVRPNDSDAVTRPPESANAPSQTASLPTITLSNRMIVYNTSLTLLVRSVDESVGAVGEVAVTHGGYVAGVENSSDNGLPVSTVRIKVLPDRYQAAMSQLRRLAIEVRDEKATTQDVTEEYSDLNTQLESLEATHRQLLDLLARATTMEEILRIQQQAAQVKLQIDRLRGRATALERLSELATIAVRMQSAEAVLGKDYVAVRTQLRQAQSQQASLLQSLKRARTPEEEAKIRDTLGELALQIERATARLEDIRQKAAQAGVTLPIALTEAPGLEAPAEASLPEQYIATRVQLRRAEARQAEITRRLKLSLPPEEQEALRQELSEKILEISSLQVQQKAIQERAMQAGVILPSLTPEQEAALAGTTVELSQPDPLRAVATAWEASLAFLRGVLATGLGALVFLWWTIPLAAGLVILVRSGRLPEGWRVGRRTAATGPGGVESPGA